MTFSLSYLFLAALVYLSLLFLVAYATEHNWIPNRIARHPLTYVLSLGVYATSWTYYGSVGFADSQGYSFLTIYLGVTVAFMMTPILLQPILRLVREYQLTSPADLFAFRFRSQLAGIMVTLFMTAGTLPYLALQIRAVTESVQVLTQEATPRVLALGFCVTLILFAILFGARHISPREKHEGLVVAIAFESLIKLLALLMVGTFALFGVFGGPAGLGLWLEQHPEALAALYQPAREGPWATLMFLAFAAAFLLPRQFHMTFTENIEPRSLQVASWGFPLYLLLLNLTLPVILWAGHALQVPTEADYFVLGVTLDSGSNLMTVLAFVGGVSAASAMMIVTTVALSAMCVNHLILPASFPDPTVNLYRWLLWGRRIVIALLVMAGYAFYRMLEHNQGLVELGLISFVAVAQLVPGVVGLLYWPRANRYGFLVGLCGGGLVWLVTLVAPLLEASGQLNTGFSLAPWLSYTGQDKWTFVTFWSLAVNTALFVAVSIATRQTVEEEEAARACTLETYSPRFGVLRAASPDEFTDELAPLVGGEMARKEVEQALQDLEMERSETRPPQLRRLRDRIERNLSGLMGPELARMVVNQQLRMDSKSQTVFADTIRMVEERLEDSRTRLRGLAAELDSLRRYHRQVLQELPVGVCAVGPGGEILIWNDAMASIADVSPVDALGIRVDALPAPWDTVFSESLRVQEHEVNKMHIRVAGRARWLSLHRAVLEDIPNVYDLGQARRAQSGSVVLVEDMTDTRVLEAELAHSERLVSIGRLAAGVAHEIGNPVTGIACLAQNLRDECSDPEIRESVAQILEQTQRINAIVRSLVGFSHSGHRGEAGLSEFNLRECVEEAIRLVKLSDSGKQVSYRNRCTPSFALHGDRQRLLQVFVNVLTNACQASRPESIVDIVSEAADGWIDIKVRDSGLGIEPDQLDRVFEPFFTTKDPGEGTGLGLALSYRIVQDHGGHISVDSNYGIGTEVCIRLANPDPGSASPGQEIDEQNTGTG
jgi:Na+/proline symporter/signal transduction histidine kinase